MPPIIDVEHVTKEFVLGKPPSLRRTAIEAFRRVAGHHADEAPPFKALDDVHFSIESGEVVGIIGHNGAGKSTLLKLLARISNPTRGKVSVRGRVAPLIEVGAGLIGDLTGRENIFLNATILGMKRPEIKRRLDEIVSFAEIEEFLDTPVKRYSSGMRVRLGFSIATTVEAEVLIMDEVLAVGDLAFQRKCFDRMEELIKHRGNTVLLVSHNIRQVARLCTRAILLSHGRVFEDGSPDRVTSLFYEQANAKVESNRIAAGGKSSLVRSSGEVELVSIEILDKECKVVDSIPSGAPLKVRVTFDVHDPIRSAELIVGTHSTDFVYLTASSTGLLATAPDLSPGRHQLDYTIPYFPLVTGTYCVRFSVYDSKRRAVFVGESLKTFKVSPDPAEVHQAGSRTLNVPATWSLDGAGLGPVKKVPAPEPRVEATVR